MSSKFQYKAASRKSQVFFHRFWLVIPCATTLLVSGCFNKPKIEEVQAQSRNVLHYSHLDEPKHLDPAFSKDLYEGIVNGWMYDGLVGFGKSTDIEPRLAERWDVSENGQKYTFTLRRGASFSNGTPVTAEDVRYTFERLLRPETASDRRWVLNLIEGAADLTSGSAKSLRGLQTPTSDTVVIRLEHPSPVFLTMLAMPAASIIPRGSGADTSIKETGSVMKHPPGTGPWSLVQHEQDRLLKFEPNPHFWGPRSSLKQLLYHVQVDDNVRRRQFEAGNFDIYQVGFQVWDNWRKDPLRSRQMVGVQELRTDFFGINCSKKSLASPKVRRAIALSIDTRKIFERLQHGRGVLSHGPLPPGISGYKEDHAVPTYDPEAARKLLSEEGLGAVGAKPLRLEIWFREEALNNEIVQSAKSDLEKAGIEVVPIARDQAAFRAAIWAGQPDLFLGSWTLDYPDPEAALAPTFHSRNIPREGNQAHFSDPLTDRLIEEARKEMDHSKRIPKWQAVENRIRDMQPWVFLFHRKTYYAVQPRVKGWLPSIMYNADRFTEVIIEEPPR